MTLSTWIFCTSDEPLTIPFSPIITLISDVSRLECKRKITFDISITLKVQLASQICEILPDSTTLSQQNLVELCKILNLRVKFSRDLFCKKYLFVVEEKVLLHIIIKTTRTVSFWLLQLHLFFNAQGTFHPDHSILATP